MDTNNHGHGGGHAHGHGQADPAMGGFVSPESIQRGHEEDKVDAKSILYVPLALVATFVLAYVVVTLLINYVRKPSGEAPSNPLSAKRNEAPLNDRFERIDSSNANAPVKQPRLEGLQRVEGSDSSYWRSMNPTPDGNPRWFHPEDMRITSDYCRELGLQDYAWVNQKEKILRVPVTDAMKFALSMKDPKNAAVNYLATSEKPLSREDLLDSSRPSNAHWGAISVDPHHVEGKKGKDEHDHKDHKEKDGKDKDHKEKDSKDKEKDSKDKDNKEKDSKDKEKENKKS